MQRFKTARPLLFLYLFIICAEELSSLIRRVEDSEDIFDTRILLEQAPCLNSLMRERERVHNVLNCGENREDEESYCLW